MCMCIGLCRHELNGLCMCERIGPGSIRVEDRKDYFYPKGKPLVDPEMLEKIRLILEEGNKEIKDVK